MPINSVNLTGNVTADPRKLGKKDSPALAFTIAVNCPIKNGDEWDSNPFFMDCIAFGYTAKSLTDAIAKGTPVTVNGKLQPNNYTNKDGIEVKALQCVVNAYAVGQKRGKSNDDAPWS